MQERKYVWLKNVTHGFADGTRYRGHINEPFEATIADIPEVKTEHVTELRNLGLIAPAPDEPLPEPLPPNVQPPPLGALVEAASEDGKQTTQYRSGGLRKGAGPVADTGMPQPAGGLRNLVG